MLNSIEEFESHNIECGSYGYIKLFVPKKRQAPLQAAIKSEPNKPNIEHKRDELPKSEVKIIEKPKVTKSKKSKK
jgi:hypothetical protein